MGIKKCEIRVKGISMKQPLMLQSDCTDCKFYEGFGQCNHHGNDLIENCKDYEKNKVMGAPEKIYFRKRNKLPLQVLRDKWYETDPQNIYGSVEYTRTDAFIEKACEWLKRNTILAETTIERFKQAMEE